MAACLLTAAWLAMCIAPESSAANPCESLAVARPIWQFARQVELQSFPEVMDRATLRYLRRAADTFPDTNDKTNLAIASFREAIDAASDYAVLAESLSNEEASERLGQVLEASEQAINRFTGLPITPASSTCIQLNATLTMLASKELCRLESFSDRAIREHRQRYAGRIAPRLEALREHFQIQANEAPFRFRRGLNDEEPQADFSEQTRRRLLSVTAEVTRLRLDAVSIAPRGDRRFYYVAWVFPPAVESATRQGGKIHVNVGTTPTANLASFDMKSGHSSKTRSGCSASAHSKCHGAIRHRWQRCGDAFYIVLLWNHGQRFCLRFVELDQLQGTLVFTKEDFRR